MVMPSRKQIRPVLLRVLLERGASTPRTAVDAVTRAFWEQLTDEDLERRQRDGRSSLWSNRVRWARQDLVSENKISTEERGLWKLTSLGRQVAGELPPLNPVSAVGESEPPDFGLGPVIEDVIRVLEDPSERIAAELIDAGHDSSHPDRLEEAVGAAMVFFGFDAEQLGGPGRTDVLAHAPLGPMRYSLVIEAKSTSSGRVSEGQINWAAIEDHQRLESADHACVVGPGFMGGKLRDRAEERSICLMTTGNLAELIRLHASKPLTLIDLKRAFDTSPFAADGIPDVRAAANERSRRLHLLMFLLETIHRFNRESPDTVMAKPDVLWGAVAMAMGADEAIRGATQADVTESLKLLDALGILTASNGDGYKAQTSLAGALQIVGAYGRLSSLGGDDEQISVHAEGMSDAG